MPTFGLAPCSKPEAITSLAFNLNETSTPDCLRDMTTIQQNTVAQNNRGATRQRAFPMRVTFNDVPPELLFMIFKAFWSMLDSQASISSILAITHVSHRWREVALAISHLWRALTYNTVLTDSSQELLSLDILTHWVSHASPHTIDLTIGVRSTQSALHINTLYTHASAIGSLTLTGNNLALKPRYIPSNAVASTVQYLALNNLTAVTLIRATDPCVFFANVTLPSLKHLRIEFPYSSQSFDAQHLLTCFNRSDCFLESLALVSVPYDSLDDLMIHPAVSTIVDLDVSDVSCDSFNTVVYLLRERQPEGNRKHFPSLRKISIAPGWGHNSGRLARIDYRLEHEVMVRKEEADGTRLTTPGDPDAPYGSDTGWTSD